jgi:nucleoid-associated protein Lsr2
MPGKPVVTRQDVAMATRTITQIEDDLDGSTKDVKAVDFAFDGIHYQIDLGPANFEKFTKTLAPYVDVARKVGGRTRRSGGRVTSVTSDNATVRAWAQANGISVPKRGRIASSVRRQFEAAN